MRGVFKFCGLPVEIKYRGDLFGEYAKEYETDEKPLFTMLATDDDLAYEQEHSEEDVEYSKPYLEFIALYRIFCEKALEYGVFLCHGSVVEVDGESYLFTAPSGTGKTTHTNLWLEHFGDRAVVINGDKPLMKIEDDKVYVFGTPWDGKEHMSVNKKSPLKAICFLERAEENKIERIEPKEASIMLLKQIYRPRDMAGMNATMDFVEKLLEIVPMYNLECNVSKDAAEVAYEGMK